ncbi:MAG: LapA family protein [Burkholderiales bacterium]|nr:MAG: LapA family protein [Burkholderiales bacterium]
MTLRSLIFLLVFGALAAFVLVNWGVLNEPTTLSLAFAEVQAPLGVVMLGFIIAVTVLFLGYIVYLQMSGLLETRRHTKELQTQRALADQAEASRFTELRGWLEAEFAREATREAGLDATLHARLDALEQQLKAAVEQQGDSLSAFVGELEDRLSRESPRQP